MSGKILAVIFDLGGVAFHYRPQQRLENFAAQTGEPTETVRRRLIDSGFSISCDSGRLQGEAAYTEGMRILGHRMTMTHFRDLWVSAFSPNHDVIELARAAKSHAAVALMTNNSAMVRDGLEAHHAQAMGVFRPQLFSSDIGILKPDPRIFGAMMNLLGIEPDQALFVDDAAKHVTGAASLGIAVHHFTAAPALEIDLRARGLLD